MSWQTARCPGWYISTGHGTRGVASAGQPGVWGGERVAGSLLAPGLLQGGSTPSPEVLCGCTSSSVALCAGSSSPSCL